MSVDGANAAGNCGAVPYQRYTRQQLHPAKFRLKFNEACRRMRVHAMEKFDLLSLRECVWHHELKKAQQEAEQIFLETGERHHTIGGFKITIMG